MKRGSRLSRFGARARREQEALAAFKTAVHARGRCEECGTDKNLHAHHIVSKARAPGWPLLHDPSNGALLCRSCHDYAHSHPGESRWIKSRPL